jgi:hypothetical protein
MSTSGIGPSAELIGVSVQLLLQSESLTSSAAAFSGAVESKSTVRFIKVTISGESLVPATTIPPSGAFQQDLDKLVDVLEDDVPAYILARTDKPGSDWLAIFYVPDKSKVRDKVSLDNPTESNALINTTPSDALRIDPEFCYKISRLDPFHRQHLRNIQE